MYNTFADRNYPYSRGLELFWSPCLLVFSKHKALVSSVSWSPDGTRAVSGSYDSTIRIWDSMSGEEVLPPLHGHRGFITAVSFSVDGIHVASGSLDNTIMIWDLTTGEESLPALHGHRGGITSLAFSPGGTQIASGSRDCTIRVWDCVSGEEIASPFLGHQGSITSVSYSPNGKCIASSSHDGTIRLWDAISGGEISQPFRGHKASVLSVSFSSRGDRLVSGSCDKRVAIWDVSSGKLISPSSMAHTKAVTSVSFSHDGNFVISGSEDQTIRLWDVKSGQLFSTPMKGHQGIILSLSFHSGRYMRILSGSTDNTARVWEVRELDVFAPCPQWSFQSLRRYPGGIRADVNLNLPPLGHQGAITSLSFSPCGSRLASCSEDRIIHIWSDDCFPASPSLHVQGRFVKLLTFSADGSEVVSVSDHESIQRWDAFSGCELKPPPPARWRPWLPHLSLRDGQTIISKRNATVFGPIDADSDIFISTFSQSFKQYQHAVENPAIFVARDGWICRSGADEAKSRLSKLPPTFSYHSVVFTSCERKFALSTQGANGAPLILHFPSPEGGRKVMFLV